MDTLKNKIAIVGVGTTEYGNFPQFSDYALGAKAFKAAVEDCGIDKNRIDGLVCCRVPFYARMGEVLGLNPRWINVENLVHSDNSSDWRLAIIEADTMLEDALESKELTGNNIGEKLKNSTPGDLASLQAAWEAHLVRNRIAHEGTEFDLSQREAKRTIQLYEVVFNELNYI